MEADVKSDTETRKRMEDFAAERVISGDNSSAQVDTDPMCLTSFGDDSTRTPAQPCKKNDALVDNGAAAPKPCLSPTEMRTRTTAGNLLSAGTASTAMRTIFPRPFFLESRRDHETYQPDKQPVCPLQAKGYTNKIKANSGVRSWRFYRSSTRLPVSGKVARVVLWGGFV